MVTMPVFQIYPYLYIFSSLTSASIVIVKKKKKTKKQTKKKNTIVGPHAVSNTTAETA